jgi:hypothetical protein
MLGAPAQARWPWHTPRQVYLFIDIRACAAECTIGVYEPGAVVTVVRICRPAAEVAVGCATHNRRASGRG